MSFYKYINCSIVVVFIIFLFSTNPQKSHAFVFVDPANLTQNTISAIANPITAGSNVAISAFQGSQFAKEFVGDGIANFIAKTIIQRLTAQTVNWINSGFKGNPMFVTNPEQFFLDTGDNIASHYLSMNGPLNNLCSPFQAQIRLALVKNYLAETSPSYSCTLGQIEQNFENFTNNFENGGWDAWFNVTQNSQSNPYGAYLDAKNQLSIQIGTAQNKYQKQLDWGKGILSYERCTKTGSVAPSVAPVERKCAEWAPLEVGKESTCLRYADEVQGIPTDVADNVCVEKETVTPGSVINDQLSKALGSTWQGLEASDEINEIVAALMQQLVSRVVGGISSGLRGLTNSNTSTSGSSRTFLEQMVDSTATNSTESQTFQAGVDTFVPSDLGGTADPMPTVIIPSVEEVETQVNAKYGDPLNPTTPQNPICDTNPTDPSCITTP